mmetsp:Transcript_16539/g.46176  ORF Transcript_16539/g.46176 Transcript_16539/m.46176 type:complete len:219 (-) Transcript_16539:1729-2385(-)
MRVYALLWGVDGLLVAKVNGCHQHLAAQVRVGLVGVVVLGVLGRHLVILGGGLEVPPDLVQRVGQVGAEGEVVWILLHCLAVVEQRLVVVLIHAKDVGHGVCRDAEVLGRCEVQGLFQPPGRVHKVVHPVPANAHVGVGPVIRGVLCKGLEEMPLRVHAGLFASLGHVQQAELEVGLRVVQVGGKLEVVLRLHLLPQLQVELAALHVDDVVGRVDLQG